MQLKVQRSQREDGMMSKTVIFCLDARVEFTAEEARNITRYKLQKQVIYNSEAAQKHLMNAGVSMATGNMIGSLKGIASVAFAAMNLNISIESLQRGQHVECKSLDELLGAEDAIMTACQNLKGYLDTAATFDGREVLFDYKTGEPEVIAAAPAPMLIAPTRAIPERVAEDRYADVAVGYDEAPVLAGGPRFAGDSVRAPHTRDRMPLATDGMMPMFEDIMKAVGREWDRSPGKVIIIGCVGFVVVWGILSLAF